MMNHEHMRTLENLEQGYAEPYYVLGFSHYGS